MDNSRGVGPHISGALAEVEALARERGGLWPRGLVALGLPGSALHRLWRQGRLVRVGRGLYVSPEGELSEHHSLVQATQRVPQGIVCLLAALRFHELGTQSPPRVWLALPQKAWRPRLDLPVELVWFRGEAYTEGVERLTLEGVEVRIHGVARPLADSVK